MSDHCDLASILPFDNRWKVQISMDMLYIDSGKHKDFSFFVNGDADIVYDICNSINSVLDSHEVSNLDFCDFNMRFIFF